MPAPIAVVALAATAAVPTEAAPPSPPPEPSATAPCAKETKRLRTFKRGMGAAQRRFFRTHASKRARARFVKQQRRKLARLKRGWRSAT